MERKNSNPKGRCSFRVSTCAFASKTFACPKKTPALQASFSLVYASKGGSEANSLLFHYSTNSLEGANGGTQFSVNY